MPVDRWCLACLCMLVCHPPPPPPLVSGVCVYCSSSAGTSYRDEVTVLLISGPPGMNKRALADRLAKEDPLDRYEGRRRSSEIRTFLCFLAYIIRPGWWGVGVGGGCEHPNPWCESSYS